MFNLIFLLSIAVILGIYFIPSFIAIGRKHSCVMQITLLNTFLGWSFVAWVASLIWASTNHTDKEVKVKGSWIIIGIIFLLSLMPLFFFMSFASDIKPNSFQESSYKSVIYKTKSGKFIKEVTKSNHVHTK